MQSSVSTILLPTVKSRDEIVYDPTVMDIPPTTFQCEYVRFKRTRAPNRASRTITPERILEVTVQLTKLFDNIVDTVYTPSVFDSISSIMYSDVRNTFGIRNIISNCVGNGTVMTKPVLQVLKASLIGSLVNKTKSMSYLPPLCGADIKNDMV